MKPLIFDDEYANLDGISKSQYNEMFVKWYYSEKVQQYVHQSTQQLISLGEMNSILYMNFKSYNIFSILLCCQKHLFQHRLVVIQES